MTNLSPPAPRLQILRATSTQKDMADASPMRHCQQGYAVCQCQPHLTLPRIGVDTRRSRAHTQTHHKSCSPCTPPAAQATRLETIELRKVSPLLSANVGGGEASTLKPIEYKHKVCRQPLHRAFFCFCKHTSLGLASLVTCASNQFRPAICCSFDSARCSPAVRGYCKPH